MRVIATKELKRSATHKMNKGPIIKKLKNKIKSHKPMKNIDFMKEDIQTANKHIKKCSTSLVIREIQNKTMKIPLHIPRMTIITKTDRRTCW